MWMLLKIDERAIDEGIQDAEGCGGGGRGVGRRAHPSKLTTGKETMVLG